MTPSCSWHEVALGTADRSYGIAVAKLAGLPPAVVNGRAQEVLAALEEGREGHKPLARIDDLPLFSGCRLPRNRPKANRAPSKKRCVNISPDGLSPREALEVLYQLKAKLPK